MNIKELLGPCIICGDTGYNLSTGGPTICPPCDCGDFGRKRIERLAKESAVREAKLREIVDMLPEIKQALKRANQGIPYPVKGRGYMALKGKLEQWENN